VTTCPANIDIQSYLSQVASGNYEAALRVIKDRNPFPMVCGRVCPHPCEAECRRNLVDEPVGINFVKRFVSDWDMNREQSWIPFKAQSTGKKIAVIGAGPSGLSAAYYSAINGHDVTVFERMPHAGGMMRYGIPEYRLPKTTLDKEINIMKKLGVKIQTGTSLGTHIRLDDLKDNFDAVYLAIGSWRATPLQLEGENADGVYLGISYLEQVTRGADIKLGNNVVVIGGGNTAIDCARTALRTGAKVKLVYRRTREEMPAEPFEIEEALHEGVEMVFLTAPSRIENGKGSKKLFCMKMQLGEPDRSGRRRPVPVEGSEYAIEANTIIGAIGQSTNTQFLYNDLPVKLNKWGDIDINGKTMQSSVDKIFAGGDCVTGPATVIQAVAAGRRAAKAMNDFIVKGFAPERKGDYSCSRGSLEDLPRYEFEEMPKIKRSVMPSLTAEKRKKNFAEVELGLSEKQVRDEAVRCLECGCAERYVCSLRHEATSQGIEHKDRIGYLPYIPIVEDHEFIIRDHNKCIACGRCIAACAEIEGPDVLNFYIKHGRMLVGTRSGFPLNKTDCVSCGQCANACPCGALDYKRERDTVFNAINANDKMVIGFVAPAVRSVIASYFGINYDKASPFIAGLLRKLGFDKVFDFVFAADLTIMEETTEFLTRIEKKGVLPHFTSCCPGWVNFVERRYPDLIPHLSSCKSPQQMMGATVKNHFPRWAKLDEKRDKYFVVSIVPCVAKKYEAARPEMAPDGIRDVDAVLTTSELIEMFHLARIDLNEIQYEEYDEPYKQVTGAGVLFGASGGVAEASLRMAVEKITGKAITDKLDFEEVRGFAGVKEANYDLEGNKVRVAVISGLNNVEPIIDKMRRGVDVGYDLIEVMACPGGCICGAGHPVPEVTDELQKRQQVLVNIDKTAKYRKSQDNPDVLRLYKEYYDTPNSEVAHHLLHTTYAVCEGDGMNAKIKNKAESTFPTREFTVCICEECSKRGSRDLISRMEDKVKELKMDSFVAVKSIRLRENHNEGVYVSLDGERFDENRLKDLYNMYKMIKK
jgi:formate dehydrogenase major subunit